MTIRFALLQARNPGDRARDDELSAFCKQLGVPLSWIRPVDVLSEDPLIASRGADVVLVGGAGEYSVLDDHPAIRRFVAAVAALACDGRPMFASCFGFQALVLGLGGEILADHDNAEVGSYDLELTAEGAGDRLFSGMPQHFVAQLGHKDRAASLPAPLVNLARSTACPYQAVTIPGAPVYATQFHPELDADANRQRFLSYYTEYGRLFGEEEARRKLEAHRDSSAANALMRRFVEDVVGLSLGG